MSDELINGLIDVVISKPGKSGWIITAAIAGLCGLFLGALFLVIWLAQH